MPMASLFLPLAPVAPSLRFRQQTLDSARTGGGYTYSSQDRKVGAEPFSEKPSLHGMQFAFTCSLKSVLDKDGLRKKVVRSGHMLHLQSCQTLVSRIRPVSQDYPKCMLAATC